MKKMKMLIILMCMAFMVFGMMSSAALAITIYPSTAMGWSLLGANNPTSEELATASGYAGPWTMLYKQDVGVTGDTGTFADSYETIFNTPSSPKGATITYVANTSYINGDPIFLLVKDGRWGHYLFNLSSLDLDINGTYEYSWDGQDRIELSNFYPNGGAISHVTIYGTSTIVPEPTTLLLLGLGMIGVAGMSRKLKK